MRYQLYLTSALTIAALIGVAGFVFWQGSASDKGPSGVIGYNYESQQFWVTATGEETEARSAPRPEAAPVGTAPVEFASPDGSAFAVVSASGDDIWLSLKQDGQTRRVARLADASTPRMVAQTKGSARELGQVPVVVAWSPDSSYLAFGTVLGKPLVLHLLDVRTRETSTYPIHDGYVGEAIWSPDGRYLGVSTYSEDGKTHTVYTLDTQDGHFVKIVDGCVLVWSPDSRYVAVHRDPYYEPGIWVISPEGELVTRVTSRNAAPFAWLP